MTEDELKIHNAAIELACTACMDAVKYAGPRDYGTKVGKAFVNNIRTLNRAFLKNANETKKDVIH